MIVLALVGMFRLSSNLAAVYGIAVTLDMLITRSVLDLRDPHGWKYPLALCFMPPVFLLPSLRSSHPTCLLLDGGWFPLMIGARSSADDDLETGGALLNEKLRQDALDLEFSRRRCFASPPASRVSALRCS